MEEIENFLKTTEFKAKEDRELIRKAGEKAYLYHKNQKRDSGEPYFNHLLETAKILVSLRMGPKTVAAGFLHDVIEDNLVNTEEFKAEFGEEILFLVEGVTKLSTIKYTGLKRHVESLRKFFVATSKDPRIIIIKLADRLHNMKTLKYIPVNKQKRIALETMEIYAPLAHRLGIGKIKGELEDLAFSYIDPDKYDEVKKLLKTKEGERLDQLKKMMRSIKKELAKEKVPYIKTDYRVKHIYSLYKKLLSHEMDIDKVYDISSLRIIVSDVIDCYRVLGIIHGRWQPLPTRIKDYIAFPKPNGYKSLHTTIFTGDGGFVEIQIRTEEMHNDAEFGFASHVAYKETGRETPKRGSDYKVAWLKDLAESQKDIQRSDEFLRNLRNDFFDQRTFIFTPKGDVIDLPVDSSPIDFAYAIHSGVGDHVFGAKINGKLVSLGKKLKNGDVVEIITRKTSKPSRKWLEFSKTELARKKIRTFLENNKERK